MASLYPILILLIIERDLKASVHILSISKGLLSNMFLLPIILHIDLYNVFQAKNVNTSPTSSFPSFIELSRLTQLVTKQKMPLTMQKAESVTSTSDRLIDPLPLSPSPTSTTMKLLIETPPIGFHFLILGRPIKKVSNCDYTASGSITLDARRSALFGTHKNNF